MALAKYFKDKRIITLLIIIVALAILDARFGGPHILHFGIEFIGGTQIPITLEHPATPEEMSTILSTLQQRVSTFGLKEVTVEGIGNSEIYVIIPSVSPAEINSTISIIESQGVFQGIVNGVEALNGSSILSGSIGAVPSTISNGNVTWAVNFFLTQSAAEHFAKVVFGQANKPLYMFLDRPTKAIVLINASLLSSYPNQSEAISLMQQALALGNETIPVKVLSNNWNNSLEPFFASHNTTYRRVILAYNTPSYVIQSLRNMNYSLIFESPENMTPQIITSTISFGKSSSIISSWPAVGLLSAPLLSPSVTNGSISQSYQISGVAPPNLPLQSKINYADNQSKEIASILSGGALPVKVIVGEPTTIPPTLGRHALEVSGIAAILAVLAVSSVIVIRYKKLFLVAPILLTTLTELFIIVSIIGLVGTIDLSAVAGMIAVVGTGVDAQIIITDEILLGKSNSTMKTKLGNAFYIVWADAILLIIAMLPLFFSTSLVSIIGFAESTILGALFGVLITRPAYGAILEKHYGEVVG